MPGMLASLYFPLTYPSKPMLPDASTPLRSFANSAGTIESRFLKSVFVALKEISISISSAGIETHPPASRYNSLSLISLFEMVNFIFAMSISRSTLISVFASLMYVTPSNQNVVLVAFEVVTNLNTSAVKSPEPS